MRRPLLLTVAVFLTLHLHLCRFREIHVSPRGKDVPSCGNNTSSPCQTLRYATLFGALDGTVFLLAGGTYAGPDNVNIVFHPSSATKSSSGNIHISIIGSSDDGDGASILDAQGNARHFIIDDEEHRLSVSFKSVAMINGLASNASSVMTTNDGGSVWVGPGHDVSFDECTVSNNSASRGGALFVSNNASVRISSSTFSSNDATNHSANNMGGAMYFSASCHAQLDDVSLSNNKAGRGGALYLDSSVQLNATSCVFRDNVANQDGGAVWVSRLADLHSVDCTFNSNLCVYNGGAVHTQGTFLSYNGTFLHNIGGTGGALAVTGQAGAGLLLNGTAVVNNTAQVGGGLFVDEGRGFVEYARMWWNAASQGGAMAVYTDAALYARNASIEHNNATEGGALFAMYSSQASLLDCTIQANVAAYTGGGIECGDSRINLTHTALSGNTALNQTGSHQGDEGHVPSSFERSQDLYCYPLPRNTWCVVWDFNSSLQAINASGTLRCGPPKSGPMPYDWHLEDYTPELVAMVALAGSIMCITTFCVVAAFFGTAYHRRARALQYYQTLQHTVSVAQLEEILQDM